jgi:hypothetical protein
VRLAGHRHERLGDTAIGTSAWAIPPFWKEWTEKYVDGNPNANFVQAANAAKCDVCHQAGKPKKLRNEYGDAVNKFATKKGFDAVKAVPANGQAYIRGALNKAEFEKSKADETFGKRIENGQLPGG